MQVKVESLGIIVVAVAGGGKARTRWSQFHTQWRRVFEMNLVEERFVSDTATREINCCDRHRCRGVVTDPYPEERLNFACISWWEEERGNKGGEEKTEGGERRSER
jgi:hypothetical protein